MARLRETTSPIPPDIAYPPELPVVEGAPGRIAVLLNRNARRVSDRMARKMERIVGRDHLFYSHSVQEAESFAREIVSRGYGTVVCGGGDGTLVRTVNLVHQRIQSSNAWRIERYRRVGERQNLQGLPRFAFLRLGTGNAISDLVGSKDPLADLRRVVDLVPGRTQRLPMVSAGTDRFFFSGLGNDSLLLDDYDWLKSRTTHPLLRMFAHGVMGYMVAGMLRTLPRVFFGRNLRAEARVTTIGRGYYVDPRRGDFIEPVEPGSVLFEGSASFVGAATIPFFGYRFKAFPFARMMPDLMNLRISTIGPFSAVLNLGGMWRGTYRHPRKFLDFMVEGFHVELARPFPWQHSGDTQGPTDELTMQVTKEPLHLVDFHGARPFS